MVISSTDEALIVSNTGSGTGVYGYGNRGVRGVGSTAGVYGYSSNIGVFGDSWGGIGVHGHSDNDHGGYFSSDNDNIIEAWTTGTASDNRRWYISNSGNVYADGSFNGGGADFAEMLPAVSGLEPGEVLVIGPDGQLLRSDSPNAANVVGVYSTKPGFVGGSDEEMENPGKVPLAIMGVVPVKASAENGAIAPGDLLVTATIPGHAMRAEANPAVGTVVGKALASLAEGTGMIRTLVMLQ
jgi:hypothetical protein